MQSGGHLGECPGAGAHEVRRGRPSGWAVPADVDVHTCWGILHSRVCGRGGPAGARDHVSGDTRSVFCRGVQRKRYDSVDMLVSNG